MTASNTSQQPRHSFQRSGNPLLKKAGRYSWKGLFSVTAFCSLPIHAWAQSIDALNAPAQLQLPHDL